MTYDITEDEDVLVNKSQNISQHGVARHAMLNAPLIITWLPSHHRISLLSHPPQTRNYRKSIAYLYTHARVRGVRGCDELNDDSLQTIDRFRRVYESMLV